jgi:hypothetical protein
MIPYSIVGCNGVSAIYPQIFVNIFLFSRHDGGFLEEMRLLLDEIAFQQQQHTYINKCLNNASEFSNIENNDCPRTNLSNVVQSVRNTDQLITFT